MYLLYFLLFGVE